MLASPQAVATVSHGGACFEILNPRKSLDLTRIVSYIDDVDGCSMVSNQRDSSFSLEQGLDRLSLSQLTDASLPSFYANSLYTSLPAEDTTPKGHPTDIPSSPAIHERVRSLSDYSLNEQTFNYWSRPVQNEDNTHAYEHSFDRQRPQMTSIREESNSPALDLTRPSTPSTQTFYSESEIGEPGSPVYANGEWAQVDDRDRGIFFEVPENEPNQHDTQEHTPHEELPTPHETPLDTPTHSPTHSPMYSHFDSSGSMSASHLPYPADPYTYDPVYFDPHVQSVLAAANAETMGLRGNPARALDDLQRGREMSPRFEFQRRKSDERKSARGKGLKKFFSWRSGN